MAFQGDSIYWVELEKVVPNPFQPRREFDQKKLEELSESIRMYGVLQPLTVTRNEVQRDDGTFYTEYELIAGERRLRASKLAGTAQVPVIIREGEQNEQEKLELAIIENLQREDLNAVDRALAFRQLADSFGLSHVQVAQKVGRSREYVSNSIRLLGLPDHILEALKRGDLMEGHARTLLMLNDKPEEQEVIFREVVLKKLSVREVERIVRKIATDKVRKKNASDLDVNLIELEKQFTETLGTRVQIQKTDFGGKLTIDYFSEDDLSVILKRMKEEAAGERVSLPAEIAEKLSSDTGLEVKSQPEFVDKSVNRPAHLVEENSVSEELPAQAQAQAPTPIPAPVPVPTSPQVSHVPQPPTITETPKPTVSENNFTQSDSVPSPSPTTQPEEVLNAEAVNKPIAPTEQAPVPVPENFQDKIDEMRRFAQRDVLPEESPLVNNAVSEDRLSADNDTEEPESEPAAQSQSEDESDLYSIRNFNV